jgi:hypothetical protein
MGFEAADSNSDSIVSRSSIIEHIRARTGISTIANRPFPAPRSIEQDCETFGDHERREACTSKVLWSNE